MRCSCPHLSHKNVPKCGEGVQGKNRLWVKNTRSKPGKRKATESSQGIELRAGGGLHGPEKSVWSAGGMEK